MNFQTKNDDENTTDTKNQFDQVNSKSFGNGSKMINVIGHSIFCSLNADSLEDAPILNFEGSCVK